MTPNSRTALASTLPVLLTTPFLCALAAAGLIPWDTLVAIPIALAVLAVLTSWRLRRGSAG
ncbi:hypothetical protein ACFY1P_21385 [Streptomyces sp. NPDC001407]|uniref:hypothetical protein n=1 Tax=unclassified Streptomyces TaxID=2593676 RepID=UPI0033F346E9